ncbi:MAG: peptidase M20, partial [Gammaproteobacteria bacterium]|nr:peptidase M20 [Gammaproteobacteria bacterium]
MSDFRQIDDYLDLHMPESIAELSRLCTQPSVSAQNWGLRECAQLVGGMLEKRGFKVDIIPTGGAPVVIAEKSGRSSKT